ncbi:MAG: rod shape-determining protein RodA [Betaproteobacteria bacterium]|nr:rod shape-determining protein RodA [Betaproteobacteria bacterium]
MNHSPIALLAARCWRFVFQRLDLPLFLIVCLLAGIGMMSVYSATYDHNNRLFSQMGNMAFGFAVMWIVAQIPPQKLLRFAVPLYLFGLILLLCVWIFGIKVKGATRWLDIGIARVQPSELMKIAAPLMLAWFFHHFQERLSARHFLIAFILLAIPFLMIARQPDLGTAILVGAAGFYVIFFAGLSWRALFGMIALVAASMPLVWTYLLKDFQRRRLLTLLDPTSDPLNSGFHIIQSTIAVGSGGMHGKGWLAGTQTHLEFIPEKHTDFIFAVFSEEWGLVGNSVLLIVYFLLIGRCLMIAAETPSFFGRILAASIALTFFTCVFVNMGMVTGILPVVGIPLPFMSYGGTALLVFFCALGILMSIRTHPGRLHN